VWNTVIKLMSQVVIFRDNSLCSLLSERERVKGYDRQCYCFSPSLTDGQHSRSKYSMPLSIRHLPDVMCARVHETVFCFFSLYINNILSDLRFCERDVF